MSLLEVSGVSKTFSTRGSLLRRGARVSAVHDVTLTVELGETLGIVGESGSGKSTLGRLITGLHTPDEGTITFDGRPVHGVSGAAARRLRREVQMVFQDPYSSLDPMKTVEYTLLEPLVVNKVGDSPSRRRRVRELAERVGLGRHHLSRYPYELSGGQRQRVAVARALVTEPRLVVCDEPVSALDVSTQAQVVNLLRDLQRELGIALVFTSHDISVVPNISDRIAVLYLGELVELGEGRQLLDDPQHPYTKALLSAVPGAGKLRAAASGPALAGEVSDPTAMPPGCRLHPRCPQAMDVCRVERPALTTTPAGSEVACHLFDRVELVRHG
jgi:oligopeptide/dipeptide ABC transporter ATP-binding protein